MKKMEEKENKKTKAKDNKKETNKIEEIFAKIKIKEIFKNKMNIYLLIGVAVVIIIVILMINLDTKHVKKEQEDLTKVTTIYPDNVRQIMSNMVDVSCGGDLKFDIKIGEKLTINEINKENLRMYLFSYMDKNHKLYDDMGADNFTTISKQLFDIDVVSGIKTYTYKDYTYDLSKYPKGKIARTSVECPADYSNNHVSYLGGYSFDDDGLYIDVKVAYVKDGGLYTYDDKRLGDYDGDRDKLGPIIADSSYYRMTYVKNNGELVLSSIEFMTLSE